MNSQDSNSGQRFYTQKKISQIFGRPISKTTFFQAEEKGEIPRGNRFKSGAINLRGHPQSALPLLGEKWGFFPKFGKKMAITVFTTKGGVLKTTLSLNLARIAALHNLKTCVVGLDMQGDITQAMGHNQSLDNSEDLQEMIKKLGQTQGLADVFHKTTRLKDVILPTDLPTLFYIPETPELVAFNEFLGHTHRREYWIKEKVIDPLKEHFDLIVMDCGPNWNRLITNALVACDALLSPLECKINNFRNFKVFRHFLTEFKNEMSLDFSTLYIPTRFSPGRKLSSDIRSWYRENIPGCTEAAIRESVASEEAQALRLSLVEHVPTKAVAQEMRQLFGEIHSHIAQKNSLNSQSNSQSPWDFELPPPLPEERSPRSSPLSVRG